MRRSFQVIAPALLLMAGAASADDIPPPVPTPTLAGLGPGAALPIVHRAMPAAPAAGAWLLMGAGVVGLLGYRWRRLLSRPA